jgi:hypothetical protein
MFAFTFMIIVQNHPDSSTSKINYEYQNSDNSDHLEKTVRQEWNVSLFVQSIVEAGEKNPHLTLYAKN